MLTPAELWLTDYGYLNDASELRHGLTLARKSFAAAGSRRQPPAVAAPKLRRCWRNGSRQLERHRVCIASFSRDGDSLSQWRGYGNVGFGTDYPGFGHSNTSIMRPVVYDRDSQKRLLDLMDHLTALAWERDREDIPDKVGKLYGDGSDRMLDVVAFFKNRHFADEREVRLVHVANADVMASLGQPLSSRRFRTVGPTIIPYLTHGTSLCGIPKDCRSEKSWSVPRLGRTPWIGGAERRWTNMAILRCQLRGLTRRSAGSLDRVIFLGRCRPRRDVGCKKIRSYATVGAATRLR